MASKQYISPIRLFEHAEIAYSGEINVSRIKKQLQAEFGLSETGFIEIDEYSYTKHDVLEEIERPDFIQRLSFHAAIWRKPFTLHLLEKNEANIFEVEYELREFHKDVSFREFFSPYFAFSFNIAMRYYVNEGRFEDSGRLLYSESFLLPGEREEAFAPLRIYLDESARDLKNINTDTYKIVRPKVLPWVEGNFSYLLNALPDEFYDVKNELVLHLVNLTVRIQKANKKDCRGISQELTCVTGIPEEMEGLIMRNHNAYTSTGRSNNRNYWWLGWLVFILIKAIAGC